MMQKQYLLLTVCASLFTGIDAGVKAAETAEAGFAADGSTSVAADSSRVVDLDEIVVVSQPKDLHLLRQQPVSSSLFGQQELNSLNVRDLRDLALFVPSFTMPAYGSRSTSSMYVRGIGSRVNSPAVGVYVDNIPLVSKSMHNFSIFQLERADVLRGPQGTLYGQNTEGGLLRFYTKNPLTYQGTDALLSIGTGLTRRVELGHYSKLGDRMGLAVAAFYDGQRGFFENATTGERADRADEAGGRLRLAWQPTERLTLGAQADYQWVRQNGFPYGELDLVTGDVADPSTNRQGNYRRHMLTTGLTMEYAGDWATVHYAGSWQYLKDRMLMDIDYMPQDFMHMEQAQQQNALTQELSLKSRKGGIWNWTFGGYYSHQALKTDAPVYFDPAMNAFLSKTIEDYAYYGMLNSMAKRMGMEAAEAMIARAGGCSITMEVGTIPGLFRTPQDNFALFHESALSLTDRLTATLGLRYDLSQVSIDYNTSAVMTLDESVMGVNVNAVVNSLLQHQERNSFGQLLPKVGLSYRIDKHNSNVYATVSKGYRSGGYNIQMFSDILQAELQDKAQSARGDMTIDHGGQDYYNIRNTISYKPEESWNYEFGTHLNLADGRLQADFAAFYMQIRNQQLSVMAGNYGFGRMMVNAGKSYSCGVELSLRGSALDNRLQWAAAYGFTHAVFKEYTDSIKADAASGATAAGATASGNVAVDYSDNYVPFVPQHTFSFMADYILGRFTFGTNVAGQGKTYWDEANSYSQSLYATLGAHVDYSVGCCTVSLWGRNLTGTKYNTFAVQSAATGTTHTFAQRANPLQAGVDVRLHF